ncbi:hypothetical protein [Pseudonocardia alni]|uniref:hypothetical protein n=1 Tax=Pseudonocardia alni TaxID=33907 RepID=UPI002478766B|nr:hypothetical protein [Pseudonocardia alni]WFG47162.1 hypothetical protein PaSha_27140 [Pseudonocardia alni]
MQTRSAVEELARTDEPFDLDEVVAVWGLALPDAVAAGSLSTGEARKRVQARYRR